MENLKLDFNPLGRNRKNINRAPVSGMTLTVYDSRYSVTKEVLEALDNPERIGIGWNAFLDSFAVYADPDGDKVAFGDSGKQISNKAVRDTLTQKKNCDFVKNFYRIVDGRLYGQAVLFRTADLVEIERMVRNGKH